MFQVERQLGESENVQLPDDLETLDEELDEEGEPGEDAAAPSSPKLRLERAGGPVRLCLISPEGEQHCFGDASWTDQDTDSLLSLLEEGGLI